MPAHKVGKLWKFKIDKIDDWIRSGKDKEKYMGRSNNKRSTD